MEYLSVLRVDSPMALVLLQLISDLIVGFSESAAK